MSYDEHLISQAGGDGELNEALATVEDRVENGTMRPDDRRDLSLILALVREQAAKLEAVREWTAKFQAAQSSDIAKRDNAQFDLGYSAGRRAAGSILRAALESKP